jgi:hypothetical protein
MRDFGGGTWGYEVPSGTLDMGIVPYYYSLVGSNTYSYDVRVVVRSPYILIALELEIHGVHRKDTMFPPQVPHLSSHFSSR